MKRLIVCACSILILSGCAPRESTGATTTIHLVPPEGQQIAVEVEIAADSASQAKGLMGRTALAPDTGMLFLFRQEQMLGFWMKDTLIALDILFFRESGEMVSFATMSPCPPATQCPVTLSHYPSKFALEVPAGFVQRHGITGAWKLAIQPWMNGS
ncbi:MAG: DUF192 domain-containing protein [Candidatus Peribacteraceae bacterium]|nr:DUF192 domain-containing protein [Candidatus Peribacteraceae bacterium]